MSAELRKNRSAFIHTPILAEIVARLKAGELALAQYLGGKQAGFPRTVVCQSRVCGASCGTISCERSSGGWGCDACRHPPANAATDSAQAPIINASSEWRNASAARQTTARTIQIGRESCRER